MAGWIVRRSFGAAVTFLLSTVVVFTIAFALPGDPARAVAGRRSSEATLAAIRQRYHLDEPLPVQYVRWLSDVLHGDLGESYVSRRPVADIMIEALPTTLTLLALTVVIELSLGLLIGTAASGRRGRPFDGAVLLGCTLALAVPAFVSGVVLQDLVGVRWGILPVSGAGRGLRGYVLPAITLALPGLAVAVRLTRAETLANRVAAHVRTAESKGLPARTVTRRHVLRNSLGPFVVFAGLEIGVLAGGAVVTERVFNLPGVGRAIALAIAQRDNSLIIGFTLLLIAVYLVIDLAADVAAAALDPRLRATLR